MEQNEFQLFEESLSNTLSLQPLAEAPPDVLQRADPFLDRLKTDRERRKALQNVYYAKNVRGEADPLIPFFVKPSFDLEDGDFFHKEWHRFKVIKTSLPENNHKFNRTAWGLAGILQVNHNGHRYITTIATKEAAHAVYKKGFEDESQRILFIHGPSLHALAAEMNQYLPGYVESITSDESLNFYMRTKFPHTWLFPEDVGSDDEAISLLSKFRVNEIEERTAEGKQEYNRRLYSKPKKIHVNEIRQQLRDARFWKDGILGSDYIIWGEFGKKAAPDVKTVSSN